MKLCDKHSNWAGTGCPCCNAVDVMEQKNDLLRRAMSLVAALPWDHPHAWQLLSDIKGELKRRVG